MLPGIFIYNGCFYYSSDEAFFQIMKKLSYLWEIICIFKIVPKLIHNWIYDPIALDRYSLFGKCDYFTLPSPAHEMYFLNAKQ